MLKRLNPYSSVQKSSARQVEKVRKQQRLERINAKRGVCGGGTGGGGDEEKEEEEEKEDNGGGN